MHEIPADATEIDVSTHSRPKAAAYSCILPRTWLGSFNTQPPEGGCHLIRARNSPKPCFNTQPPEGGCFISSPTYPVKQVSTHSRPKAAAFVDCDQAKAYQVSTHSRPKAAALPLFFSPMLVGCFNTQPPEGGCSSFCTEVVKFALFQHTAARRRLPLAIFSYRRHQNVSTHSRPKAAAQEKRKNLLKCVFQHTAARRRLPCNVCVRGRAFGVSTHSRPKAAACR